LQSFVSLVLFSCFVVGPRIVAVWTEFIHGTMTVRYVG